MARWEKKDHVTLTDAEFRLIVSQMRGHMEDKATQAAYLVMVEGYTQKDAHEKVGSSAPNVNGAIQKITIRHKENMAVYVDSALYIERTLAALGLSPDLLANTLTAIKEAKECENQTTKTD